MPDSKEIRLKRLSIILSVLLFANGLFFWAHGASVIRYTVLVVSNLLLEEKRDELEYITGDGKETFGYEYAIKKISPLLSQNNLKSLSKDYFEYKLTVNGEEITDSRIEIDTSKDLIITFEQIEHESLLPRQIKEKGSVTGGDKGDSFYSHLSILTDIEYEREVEGNKVTYIFCNLNSKDKITLIPSPILVESNFNNKLSVLEIFIT